MYTAACVRRIFAAALTALISFQNVDAASLKAQKLIKSTKDCFTKQYRSFSQTNQLPGAGVDPASLAPYSTVLKDGYMYIDCVKDMMLESGDKFGDGKFSYKLQKNANVSIVHYTELIRKEDRKPMTHDVCFKFCRTLPQMGFFGIAYGRDCYCMPYYKTVAGDSSMCDEVCEGSSGTMCGGKTKTSIFEMHMCEDTAKELSSSADSAFGAAHSGETIAASLQTKAAGIQKLAAEMQTALGQVGDPVASNLMQASKVWAGKLEAGAKAASKSAKSLKALVAKADNLLKGNFTSSSDVTVAEKLMEQIDAEKGVTKDKSKDAWKLLQEASRGTGSYLRQQQYYPLMYFVNKTYVDVPTTCGGDWDQHTIFGVTPDECASACDRQTVKPECIGFSFYEGDDTGLCLLFSRFTSVTYYTKCAAEPSFAQVHEKPSKNKMRIMEPVPILAQVQASTNGYIDFSNTQVVVNNLGGLGPDSGDAELRYAGVGEIKGKAIDLVIKASGYEKAPNSKNGLFGKMGQISIKAGSAVTLKFMFQDQSTKLAVEIPDFFFSFFDIDMQLGVVEEQIIISDYVDFYASEGYEFTETKEADGRTAFQSVRAGEACDNPTDPTNLGIACNNVDQKKRAVTFRFIEKSAFTVTLTAKCLRDCPDAGRNFLFSTPSAVDPVTTTTTTTTERRDIKGSTTTITTTTPPVLVNPSSTQCYAKLEDFVGTNLSPDPSGKCRLCLKKATKANRCLGS